MHGSKEADVHEQFKVRQKHPVTGKSGRRNKAPQILSGPLNISGTNGCYFAWGSLAIVLVGKSGLNR
jgi:hypothetical protein